MNSKYRNWHDSLHPLNQFIVSFMLNWLYWFVAWFILEKFVLNDHHSLLYQLFFTMAMSFIMTIPFNWKKLKQIFSPFKKEQHS